MRFVKIVAVAMVLVCSSLTSPATAATHTEWEGLLLADTAGADAHIALIVFGEAHAVRPSDLRLFTSRPIIIGTTAFTSITTGTPLNGVIADAAASGVSVFIDLGARGVWLAPDPQVVAAYHLDVPKRVNPINTTHFNGIVSLRTPSQPPVAPAAPVATTAPVAKVHACPEDQGTVSAGLPTATGTAGFTPKYFAGPSGNYVEFVVAYTPHVCAPDNSELAAPQYAAHTAAFAACSVTPPALCALGPNEPSSLASLTYTGVLNAANGYPAAKAYIFQPVGAPAFTAVVAGSIDNLPAGGMKITVPAFTGSSGGTSAGGSGGAPVGAKQWRPGLALRLSAALPATLPPTQGMHAAPFTFTVVDDSGSPILNAPITMVISGDCTFGAGPDPKRKLTKTSSVGTVTIEDYYYLGAGGSSCNYAVISNGIQIASGQIVYR